MKPSHAFTGVRVAFLAGLAVFGSGTHAQEQRDVQPVDESIWGQQIQANYPYGALQAMIEGTVGVEVRVAPTGNIMKCEVTSSSGHPILDDGACVAMVRYAKFEPALDANGEPIEGSYATRITYRMNTERPEGTRSAVPRQTEMWAKLIQMNYPFDALRREAEGTVGVRAVIDERGLVSRCFVTATSGDEVLDEAACVGMLRFAMFFPALDENDEPTTGGYRTRITYRLKDKAPPDPVPLKGEGREITL